LLTVNKWNKKYFLIGGDKDDDSYKDNTGLGLTSAANNSIVDRGIRTNRSMTNKAVGQGGISNASNTFSQQIGNYFDNISLRGSSLGSTQGYNPLGSPTSETYTDDAPHITPSWLTTT